MQDEMIKRVGSQDRKRLVSKARRDKAVALGKKLGILTPAMCGEPEPAPASEVA
jgi:hypothetical protein